MRRRSFYQGLSEQSAEKRAVHLDHVWQIQIEYVSNRLLHDRMIPANVENTVAAQKVEKRLIIHVIEVSAFASRIDLIKADYSLRLDQRWIYVPLMELVVLT